jgi:hypothetical protein
VSGGRGPLAGILFHCFEYPASASSILPGIHLGLCQQNSDCTPCLADWRFRNVLWLTTSTGVAELWALDGASPAIAEVRSAPGPFGASHPNAVSESLLGRVVGDVYCVPPGHRDRCPDSALNDGSTLSVWIANVRFRRHAGGREEEEPNSTKSVISRL